MKHINVSLFVPHMGCPHNCVFCDQKAISGKTKPLTPDAVRSACDIARKCPHDMAGSEVAFFGGSFTAIPRHDMVTFLEAAKPYIGSDFAGIRISTRPDCIDDEVLEILKGYGVTSIELGAQSMDADVLLLNERGHTPEDTYKASDLIKKHGFSLGLQMMTGLYGSDEKKDRDTARAFVDIKPDTVRIYPTVVLENTKLANFYRSGIYTPPGLDESAQLCADLLTLFRKNSIRVIRLGLHSGGNVGDGYVAGVYHPAFGEICEGLIFRRMCEERLVGCKKGMYTVFVNPKAVSKMIGQKKSNMEYFLSKGYVINVKKDELLDIYDMKISKGID